jgi:hypothetical protein
MKIINAMFLFHVQLTKSGERVLSMQLEHCEGAGHSVPKTGKGIFNQCSWK